MSEFGIFSRLLSYPIHQYPPKLTKPCSINTIKDLHSLLLFLGITGGLERSDVFNTVITRPLSEGNKGAEALLQSLMQDLCLRRKKDMKFVDLKLPPKTEYVHRINFRPGEQAKYDALLSEAKGALEEYQMKSNAGQKGRFQGVLERLLRLRQAYVQFPSNSCIYLPTY